MFKVVLRLLLFVVFFLWDRVFFTYRRFCWYCSPGFTVPGGDCLNNGYFRDCFGIGYLSAKSRLLAGKLAAISCLLVLPANIYQAHNDVLIFGSSVAPELLWLCIPLQFVLIVAILWSTGIIGRTLIQKSTRSVDGLN